jgi:hypothetical protein
VRSGRCERLPESGSKKFITYQYILILVGSTLGLQLANEFVSFCKIFTIFSRSIGTVLARKDSSIGRLFGDQYGGGSGSKCKPISSAQTSTTGLICICKRTAHDHEKTRKDSKRRCHFAVRKLSLIYNMYDIMRNFVMVWWRTERTREAKKRFRLAIKVTCRLSRVKSRDHT